MTSDNHQIARAFFSALTRGDVPDELLTPDVTVWTTSTGKWSNKAHFQYGIRVLASIFPEGLHYTLDSLTAEDDRVAAEVQSTGTLTNGDPYYMRYVFILRIRDGRIASVCEHNDPGPVREKLGPLLRQAVTKTQ
jgi:ketosteroid isomerase-like protein